MRSRTEASGRAVTVGIEGGIARLRLARPRTGNALDAELLGALADACESVEHDDRVRVVLLSAAGDDFCVGLPPRVAWPPAAWADGVAAVAGLTRPVVASLQGAVHGWGLALALACDLRVAAATATFRVACVPQGRLPGGGLTQRLTRIVGPSRALAMLLLGEPVPSRTGVAWGLASRAVAPTRLDAAADELARGLAERAPLALRLGKEAVIRALDLPLADGLRLEHDLYVLLQTTADRAEGVRSFLARRAPRYEGR